MQIDKIIKESEKTPEEKKKILEEVKINLEKKRTMNLSIKEGSATSVMSGLGESYIVPFAIALKSSNFQISMLTSFTGLISPIAQIFGSNLMEKNPRKKIICIGVAFQALMWIPILLLGIFMYKNILTSYLPFFLILFYILYAISGAIAGPAWFSLMGDLVPEKKRGEYFGNRNKIAGTIALIATLTGAFILDYFKTHGIVLIGFAVLFFFASIFRLISASLFRKHYDPEFKLNDGYYFSLWQFLKKAYSNNFGRFAIMVALMQFATAISGPFFAVYMLKDLQFSYATFMFVNISASIASLLVFPFLGRFSDKYGNRELIKLGAILIPFVPILWLISPNPIYIILIPQLLSGAAWAAFNLGAGNFIYDSVTPQKRGLVVAYYNVLIGIGIFIGATLGGLLAQYLTITFMNILLFIFLVSGLVRLAVVIFMLPKIREVKTVKKPKSNPLIYIKEIRPIKGIIYEAVHDITKVKKIIWRKRR